VDVPCEDTYEGVEGSGRPSLPNTTASYVMVGKNRMENRICCRCVRRDCGIHFRMVTCTKIVLALGQVGSCFIPAFFRGAPDFIVVTDCSAVRWLSVTPIAPMYYSSMQ
jgi:hypothetical protein